MSQELNMNNFTLDYARIMCIHLSLNDDLRNIDIAQKVCDELKSIYQTFQKNNELKNYINAQIKCIIEGFKGRIRTRSVKNIYDTFQKTYQNLMDNLYGRWYSLDNQIKLERFILGYIHFRNISFEEIILKDWEYSFNGDLDSLFISKEEVEDEEDTIYKSKWISLYKRKKVNCLIPLKKIDIEKLFKYSINDKEILRKVYHLFSPSFVFTQKEEERCILKNFIEDEKKMNLDLLQDSKHTKERIISLITKDVITLINDMIFPKFGKKELLEEKITEVDRAYQRILGVIERNEINELRIVKEVSNFILETLLRLENIKKEFEGIFKRQQMLKIASYLFLILKSNPGKNLILQNSKFRDSVEKKKKELIDEVRGFQEEERENGKGDGEQYNWFIDILKD